MDKIRRLLGYLPRSLCTPLQLHPHGALMPKDGHSYLRRRPALGIHFGRKISRLMQAEFLTAWSVFMWKVRAPNQEMVTNVKSGHSFPSFSSQNGRVSVYVWKVCLWLVRVCERTASNWYLHACKKDYLRLVSAVKRATLDWYRRVKGLAPAVCANVRAPSGWYIHMKGLPPVGTCRWKDCLHLVHAHKGTSSG